MHKKGFTLIELLVVISIIALLMSIMMPSLNQAKLKSYQIVCQSNMRQWGIISTMFTQDNHDKWHKGWISDTDGSQIWVSVLRPYYDDPKLRLCPTAKNPQKNGSPFGTWGPFPETGMWYDDLQGDYGSIGINWYVCNRDTYLYAAVGSDDEAFWKTTNVRNADEIPVFFDSWWLFALPDNSQRPPAVSGETHNENNLSMLRACLDRHQGYTSCSFMDGSARKVALKELWTLRWNRLSDMRNRYTLAGNPDAAQVWDSEAPWMSKYPEY